MDLSTYLAQAFGLVYTVIGVSMFLRPADYQTMLRKLEQSPLSLLLFGLIDIVIGFSILTYHNVWAQDWRLILTALGWIAFVKGVVLVVMPSALVRQADFWRNKMMIVATFTLGFGLVLGYFGFAT